MRQREGLIGADASALNGRVGGGWAHGRVHFWLLQVRKIDLKGRAQRFQRFDAGGLSSLEALNGANAQAAQIGQLLLRPASLQPELLDQHGETLQSTKPNLPSDRSGGPRQQPASDPPATRQLSDF